MTREYVEKNRLKLQIDKTMREVNRNIINPVIPELRLQDLEPILTLVAKTRAAYLKELFEVTKAASGQELPSPEQIRQLKHYREMFEELRQASLSLETAIERGYLDVLS